MTRKSLPIAVLFRLAFPVALLLFAGFFFGGHLGWWSDDHWHNLRDPITGRAAGFVMRRGFFLRPLFYTIVPALTTALWHHDWAAHAIQIASHGVVVVMLWRLLRMLGIGERAAGAAALLFMMYPGQFEALYWFAALPTSMSSEVMLGVMMLAVSFARGRSGWWAVPVMAILTFAACCLNEQPASVAGVLPVLAWLVGNTRRSQRGIGVRQSEEKRVGNRGWVLALAPGAACVLAGAVYVAIVMLDPRAPHGARGQAETLVHAGQLWERTAQFLDLLWRRVLLKNWAGGAVKLGLTQVAAAGWPAWLALAGLAALGVAWACAGATQSGPSVNEGDAGSEQSPPGWPRIRWDLCVLGAAVCIVGWLPIWAISSYAPDSRCRYWPSLGLAIVAAAVTDAVGRRSPEQSSSGAADGASRTAGWIEMIAGVRLVLAAFLVLCAVMLIAAQSGFRSRWRMDAAEGAELRRLVPDPAPYTMFVPVHIRELALDSGGPVLDTHYRSVWEFPWSASVFIERAYRRGDVRCGFWRQWTPTDPVRGGDAQGIHYNDGLGPMFPPLADGTHLIPWDRAVLFTIGEDHVLRIATRVVLEKPGEPDVVIEVPQARGLPEFEVRLPRR